MEKAWETALAPFKSLPMNAFMLYMSGNGIQIFSILITVMLLFNSIKSIMETRSVFKRFESEQQNLNLPMLTFILIQAGNFLLGVYKCSSMGLLPTASSDWLAFMEKPLVLISNLGIGKVYWRFHLLNKKKVNCLCWSCIGICFM